MVEEAKKEEIVACDGGGADLYSGHPKVYVKVPEGETRLCPYCGKVLESTSM